MEERGNPNKLLRMRVEFELSDQSRFIYSASQLNGNAEFVAPSPQLGEECKLQYVCRLEDDFEVSLERLDSVLQAAGLHSSSEGPRSLLSFWSPYVFLSFLSVAATIQRLRDLSTPLIGTGKPSPLVDAVIGPAARLSSPLV